MSDGETTWTYTYGADGLRTGRTDGLTGYTYVYTGSRLTCLKKDNTTMRFVHDASGPMSVEYNGEIYLYLVNIQGDVFGIMNCDGEVMVEYSYDAWGNVLSITGPMATTLGQDNPLRYRGYVYDTETQLYYLQSRYYNPEIGRFLNADAYASTGQGIMGFNMFAYCNNNPVNKTDPAGNIPFAAVFAEAGSYIFAAITAAMFTMIAAQLAENLAPILGNVFTSVQSDIKEFAKSIADTTKSMFENEQPRIHHIVPPGAFSNRSLDIQQKLIEMRVILRKAGIDPENSPFNKVVVSQGLHKSLHTDAYITVAHAMLMETNGEEWAVHSVLFYLRLWIAARDKYFPG